MEYQIRPFGKTCAASGRPLAPGQDCISVLVEKGGQLVRQDFAVEAWTTPPAGTVGFWRTQAPQAAEIKATSVDPELLLQMFEQLVESANPAHDRLLYVLALALLQRRRLHLDGARADDEGQVLDLSGSRGEGPFVIRDQQLPQEEIRRVQAELDRHLSEQGTESQAA